VNYAILNDGCSYSADWSLPESWGNYSKDDERLKSKRRKWRSYCEFLPGDIYNIAKGGSGIQEARLKLFLQGHVTGWKSIRLPADTCLTHFIYQVPSITRQVIHTTLNDEDFFKAPIDLRTSWELYDTTLKQQRVDFKEREWLDKNIVSQASNLERYVRKALNVIHNYVTTIRSRWPDIKIIFLRYARSDRAGKLIYEFNKEFYKTDLRTYCDNNNITYIYENNFHTKWFTQHKLTNDGEHPNDAGATVIANKIKEYL